jgi:hypothetical protein
MRNVIVSLFALLLSVAPVFAAPAPFAKPNQEPDPAVVVEQLKQFMLREHNAYADRVVATSNPNEWIVTGNTPMAPNGDLEYAAQRYRATASPGERRGTMRFTVTAIPRYTWRVITR